MTQIIQQLLQLHDFLSPPNRSMWVKPIAYLFASILLLVGYGIGAWAMYVLLLNYVGQAYSLLSVSLLSMLLSLVAFLIGSKWRANKNGYQQLVTLASNTIGHLQDNRTLQKVIKAVPPKSLALIIAGTWLISHFLGSHKKS